MRSFARTPRELRRFATVILLAAAACEKAKPAKDPATAILPDGVAALDLAGKPDILFQVFGDRESPHVMPIAAVVKGVIKPIGLTRAGWKQLDAQYMAPGTKYGFYVDGGGEGELTLANDTTYTLPGCTVVKPMAVGRLAFKTPRDDPTVEFLASSGTVAPPRPESEKVMSSADIERLARSIGHAAGRRVNLTAVELDSLDFHARLIPTGASSAPTMLISFIDPNSGTSRGGPWAGHVFVLADSGANGYEATYVHAVKGDARSVEFQRLVNHVDFNGDGADEIILEAWKYGANNDLIVLSFKAGRWQEVLRARQDWCLSSSQQK